MCWPKTPKKIFSAWKLRDGAGSLDPAGGLHPHFLSPLKQIRGYTPTSWPSSFVSITEVVLLFQRPNNSAHHVIKWHENSESCAVFVHSTWHFAHRLGADRFGAGISRCRDIWAPAFRCRTFRRGAGRWQSVTSDPSNSCVRLIYRIHFSTVSVIQLDTTQLLSLARLTTLVIVAHPIHVEFPVNSNFFQFLNWRRRLWQLQPHTHKSISLETCNVTALKIHRERTTKSGQLHWMVFEVGTCEASRFDSNSNGRFAGPYFEGTFNIRCGPYKCARGEVLYPIPALSAVHLWMQQWKNYQNWLTYLPKLLQKIKRAHFFIDHSVVRLNHDYKLNYC